MKITKAESRDKKRRKSRYGMKVSGRSVKLIQEILIKKGTGKIK